MHIQAKARHTVQPDREGRKSDLGGWLAGPGLVGGRGPFCACDQLVQWGSTKRDERVDSNSEDVRLQHPSKNIRLHMAF